MNAKHHLPAASILALISLMPAMAQRTYDCGNANQRACGHGDWERVNMVAGDNRACEHDLVKVDGVCLAIPSRNTSVVRNRLWSGWALENQSLSIGKDAPINFITWPASHNAYSTVAQGFQSDIYTNHELTITDQLNAGARMLELDPKFYLMMAYPLSIPISDTAVRLCHGPATAACTAPGWANRLFGFALKEIADWVDANPGQVLYLKLDNGKDIGSRIEDVYAEIERYLGSRVYRVPSAGQSRWPTLQEIRNAGKSIIAVQHNIPADYETTWVWKAIGLVQSDNHPKDQDFDTCTANDGMTQIERGSEAPRTWWDIAEGRAISNSGSYSTGVLWEEDVRKATKCGVASIGLDFINALNSEYNIDRRNITDNRMKAMIWSWTENDWGRNGPAALNSDGRWSSVPATNAFSLACALKRPYGSPRQDRQWRITAADLPWNLDLANAQCASEFGSDYEFAVPENGLQNEKLRETAAGRRVWLRYTLVEVPNLNFSTNRLTFRMDPAGALPTTQFIVLTASPGTRVGTKYTSSLPIIYNLPADALNTGIFSLPISIGQDAANLPPGEYNASIDFSADNVAFTVAIQFIVKAAPVITTASESAGRQGFPYLFNFQLTRGNQLTGDVKFYRIRDSQGIPVFDTAAATSVVSTGNATGGGKVEVSNLPLGTHTYAAYYEGNGRNIEATSESFTVTITPRIVATPASVVLQYTPGGNLPSQNVSLSGLGANPAATASCDWLKFAINGTTLTVSTTNPIQDLAPGSHHCTLTLRDALSAQNLGETVIPVTVQVQTALTRQPLGTITLLGENSASSEVMLNTSGGTSIDYTFATSHPWLRVEPVDQQRAPGTFRILVNGQSLPVGVNNGSVTISSPFAPSIVIPVAFQKVTATLVTTNPAGLAYSVDGQTYTSPMSFVWAPGSVHNLSMSVQTNNGTRSRPKAWTNNLLTFIESQIQVTARAEGYSFTAVYSSDYQLLLQGGTGGAVGFRPYNSQSDGFFPAGTVVEVEATPAPGYQFVDWSGSISSTNRNVSVTMNAPRTLIARFSPTLPTRIDITSSVFGARATIDGIDTMLPASLQWIPGSLHTISANAFVSSAKGTRFAFLNWSNGGAQTQTITTPSSPLNLSVSYQRQFLVATTPSPLIGGNITGSGWFNEGAAATLTATAANGFAFSSFSGNAASTSSPFKITVTSPLNIVGNFAPSGTAALKVLASGARTNGPGREQRFVPISITNSGLGAALGVRITGISGIRVMSGSGTVAVASPMPLAFGDLIPGASATQSLLFNWPVTATRVQFSITYLHDNGAPGIITLNLFR